MFFMETKQRFSFISDLQQTLGYDKLVIVEPIGLSGGLVVMWKSCFDVEILSSDKRIIDMKVSIGSITFFFTCVYGDPVRARRREVWNRLVHIGLMRDEPWLLTGDFNELLSNDEKLGGDVREDSTFWDFRSMVQECKVRELRTTGNSLSWEGVREQVWVQCRLDRSFGNDGWFHLFPKSITEYQSMWASDHRPLRISFSLEISEHNKGRFYFDKRMLQREGFIISTQPTVKFLF